MIRTGTLEKRAFAGVVWVLVTDAGQYELKGDIPAKLEGAVVRVEGDEAANQFSMNMVGPIIDVVRITAE